MSDSIVPTAGHTDSAVTASPEQKPQNRFDYLRPLPADRPCALCKEVFEIENGCELLDKQLPLPLRPGDGEIEARDTTEAPACRAPKGRSLLSLG